MPHIDEIFCLFRYIENFGLFGAYKETTLSFLVLLLNHIWTILFTPARRPVEFNKVEYSNSILFPLVLYNLLSGELSDDDTLYVLHLDRLQVLSLHVCPLGLHLKGGD